MWLNLKPFTTQKHSSIAIPYTLGISGPTDMVDQRRNVIKVIPGKELLVNAIPRIVQTTTGFNALDIKDRRCKLTHEIDGLQMLSEYSRVGCEMDCATDYGNTGCGILNGL